MADAPQEPVSLDEARTHLRDPAESDDFIAALIAAARDHAERVTGLILTRRSVTETAPTLGRWIDLNAWPIVADQAVTVSYLDAAGATQQLPASAWRALLTARPARLTPIAAAWGVSGGLALDPVLPVSVSFTAGYLPTDVPASVKAAMLLMIGHLYRNREAVTTSGASSAPTELPMGVEALLRPYRLMRV